MRHFDVLKLLIHNSSPLSLKRNKCMIGNGILVTNRCLDHKNIFISFKLVILPTLYVRIVYEYHFEFQTICLASLATV